MCNLYVNIKANQEDIYEEAVPITDDHIAEMRLLNLISLHYDQFQALAPRSGPGRRRADSILKGGTIMVSKAILDKLSVILRDIGTQPTAEEIDRLTRRHNAILKKPNSLCKKPTVRERESCTTRYLDQKEAYILDETDIHELVISENLFTIEVGKEGRNIILLNTGMIYPAKIDMVNFIRVFLQQANELFEKPFDVIVNFSLFGPENEWPSVIIDQFEKSLSKLKVNISNLIALNVNHNAKQYSKRIMRVIGARRLKIKVFSSALEFAEFLSAETLLQSLDKKTSLLLQISTKIYSNITRIIEKQSFPVTVQVSSEFICVSTAKKQEVFGSQGLLVEYYKLESISQFGPTQLSADGSTLQGSIYFNHDIVGQGASTKQLILEWPKASPLIEVIKANVSRLVLAKPNPNEGRDMSAPDVFSTLLNTALLTLAESDDAQSRNAGYSLLQEIGKAFNFQEVPLVYIPGMSIPKNTSKFVLDISSSIAKSEKHLSLEFILETLRSFDKYSPSQKQTVLRFLPPWIENIEIFINPLEPTSAQGTEGMREHIKMLISKFIQLTLTQGEVHTTNQRFSTRYKLASGLNLRCNSY
jgi:hypothetical protein